MKTDLEEKSMSVEYEESSPVRLELDKMRIRTQIRGRVVETGNFKKYLKYLSQFIIQYKTLIHTMKITSRSSDGTL